MIYLKNNYKMQKIILKWNPYSTNNIYMRNWNRWFIKKKPREQKESYKLQAKIQKISFLKGLIKIRAYLYFWDKRKRDIDNYNKLWLDALSWIIYEDDKQVIELHIIKWYDKENPRIELEIY